MSKYLELPWSVEDTIENMRKLKEMLQKMCITDNLDGRGEKDEEEVAFDFDRAINALEKQIPKKPNKCIGFTKSLFVCPACGRKQPIMYEQYYCKECGQKLDWSDEE